MGEELQGSEDLGKAESPVMNATYDPPYVSSGLFSSFALREEDTHDQVGEDSTVDRRRHSPLRANQ